MVLLIHGLRHARGLVVFRHGRLLMRDVEREILNENIRSVIYESCTLPSLTFHRPQFVVKLHLVAAVIDKVGMEDGIDRRSSKNAISAH